MSRLLPLDLPLPSRHKRRQRAKAAVIGAAFMGARVTRETLVLGAIALVSALVVGLALRVSLITEARASSQPPACCGGR